MSSYSAPAAAECRPLFTASQWQELEHQALVFKYLVAGIPVPPDLLLPIRKSLESMAARFYHHPTLSYCSIYGKKPDPEPWRCRRTDGKKWRCSKNAHPESKYCERHMHRGRNRSRKPVETQTLPQLQSSTSSPFAAGTTLAPSGSRSVSGGSGSGSTGSFPSGIPLQSLGSGAGNSASQLSFTRTNLSQPHIGPGYYQMGSGDSRYLVGFKSEVDEHNFLSEASGRGTYPQLQTMQAFAYEASRQQQQQHCFFKSEFDSKEPVKLEQPLHSFFDEWPKTRDSWSDLEDDKSNITSFSTTQLSISIPMAASDFSTTSSRSPNGDD